MCTQLVLQGPSCRPAGPTLTLLIRCHRALAFISLIPSRFLSPGATSHRLHWRADIQFRADGPPALASAEYAADYNEVQRIGALNSVTRTPDQTEAALFWMENMQITWNNIARIAVTAAHSNLFETAHVFALLKHGRR